MSILFWLKIGACIALVAGVAWGLHEWKDALRDEGREEVRAEWAAARVAAEKAATLAAKRAEIDATAKELQRDRDFKALANRARRAELNNVSVSPVLVDGLRDAVRTSNNESTGGAATSATPASGAADGNQINDWFADVARLYRACREQVIGWIKWDDERVKVQ